MTSTGSGEIEKPWNFEHKGDEGKAEIVASAADTLAGKVEKLFQVDGVVYNALHPKPKERGPKDFPERRRYPRSTGSAISGTGHRLSRNPHWILWVLLIVGIITLTVAVCSLLAVHRIETDNIERGKMYDERFRDLAGEGSER